MDGMDEGMSGSEAEGFFTRPAAVLVAFGGEGTVSFRAGDARKLGRVRAVGGMRVWKPAVQQWGKAIVFSRSSCQDAPA